MGATYESSTQGGAGAAEAPVEPYERDEYTISIGDKEYTPVVEPKMLHGDVVGYELLLRDRHTRASVGDDIVLAEEQGTVAPFVHATLDITLLALSALQAKGVSLVPIAVNIPLQELQGATLARLLALATSTPAIVARVELEITEREIFGDEHVPPLAALHAAGYHITLDDFDTEHCNMTTLERVSGLLDVVDTFKLDKTPLTTDPLERGKMLRWLADQGKKIVIEGVEQDDHVEAHHKNGHATQGYVHGNAETLSAFVQRVGRV